MEKGRRKLPGTPRELWAIFAPGIAVTVLGFLLAWSLIGPAPPKRLVFAGGSGWGAYYKYAQRYAELLATEGLQVEVLETRGSADNLQLLAEGKADIALVQGGVELQAPGQQLRCLGSVYYEPLWVFVRDEGPVAFLTDLKGKRLAIGPEGSGTRAIALQLLEDNRLLQQVETVAAGGEQAEAMLLSGQVDGVFIVGDATIPVVKRLLVADGIRLKRFRRAQAYVRRHQFLSQVTLFEGVVDLAANMPPEDIPLIAPAATLVVAADFHPALVSVVLSKAQEIHGHGGMLNKPGEFPSPLYCSFPVSEDARHFYKYGASYLYRHMPFHIANALDRMAILLLPFLGLLIPTIRMLPPVYNWTMKRKIHRRYRALQLLEAARESMDHDELVQALEEVDREIAALNSMPASFGADIHALRIHFERLQKRLTKQLEEEG